ncbi:BAR-domain-containing protein [Sarocladium strictum]
MIFTKKIDRAFQWAGEKMGGEAKTSHSDEFKMLETEMTLRQDGAEKLHKSANVYIKWSARKCDGFEDKEKNTPIGFLGRSMTVHGEDFEPDSEFGNCLSSLGQANERIAAYQESYLDTASETWLEHLERTVASMKEYQTARKKLENRRLAYDASTTKLQKSKRDDFRVEEEVRANKVKFEESSEDVLRRMQDIKEAEVDSISALTSFLDAELEYHDRCADELRRVRQSWAGASVAEGAPMRQHISQPPQPPRVRSRSNTARSWQEPKQRALYEEPEPSQLAVRTIPPSPGNRGAPPQPPRPSITRALTSENRVASRSSLRAVPHQLSRVATDTGTYGHRNDDVFADDASTGSGSRSPDWGDRSVSPATSYGSLSHSTAALSTRKPPPPPVNRAKKPPPPPVPRKINVGL